MGGLWKESVPTTMYGTEVTDIGKKKEIKELERVQNKAARRGLGANNHVRFRGTEVNEQIDRTEIKNKVSLEHMNEKKMGEENIQVMKQTK